MRRQRGQTLVATMIVLVIISILAVVYFVGSGTGSTSARPDGKGQTTVGAALMKARDTECKQQLMQIRQAVQLGETVDGTFPSSIEAMRLGRDFETCPIGSEPYEYNPETGKVKCPHPGHGKY